MAFFLVRYRVESVFPSSSSHPSPAFYKLSGSAGVEIVLTGFLSVEDMHLQVRVAPTGPPPPRARAHRGARSQPLWCDFRKERKPDNSEISQASWEVPAQVLALNRVRCDAVPSVMVASQRWLDDDGAYRVAVLTEQMMELRNDGAFTVPEELQHPFIFYPQPVFHDDDSAPLVGEGYRGNYTGGVCEWCDPGTGACTPCPRPQQFDTGYFELAAAAPPLRTFVLGPHSAQLTPLCQVGDKPVAAAVSYVPGEGPSDDGPTPSSPAGRIVCPFPKHQMARPQVTFSLNGREFFDTNKALRYRGCPPGMYAPAVDAACLPCGAGMHGALEGSQSCNYCGHLQYQDAEGAIVCKSCPPNTWVPARGGTSLAACSCLPHAENEVLDAAVEVGGFIVPPGTERGFHVPFPLLAAGPGQECEMCPEGSVCPGGLAAPLALPGYFAWHENGKYEVHRCAGPNATERCPGYTSGDKSRDGNAWGQCGYRYRDFMCDGCGRRFDYEDPGEGYFRSNQNSCEKCPTTDPVLIVMMLATVVVLVLFLCFFVAVRLAKINVKAFAPFTIATDYYQMLAIMPLLQLAWPEQVQQIYDLHKFLALDLDIFTSQTECAVTFTWFARTAIYFLLPLAMALGVLLIMLLLFLLHGCGFHFGFRGSRGVKTKRGLKTSRATSAFQKPRETAIHARDEDHHQPEWVHLYNMCLHAFLYMLNFSYMLITKRALQFLDCKWMPLEPSVCSNASIAPDNCGHYVLEKYPSVKCFTFDQSHLCYPWATEFTKLQLAQWGGDPSTGAACWRDMCYISLFGIVLYVIGIPGLFTFKLVTNRHYAIFTKSISLQEARLRQRPRVAAKTNRNHEQLSRQQKAQEVVQEMLDLCQSFATYLRRHEPNEHFLYFHTTRLSNMLIKAQKHLLEERKAHAQAESAGASRSLFKAASHAARHDKLAISIADHTNTMVVRMDEYRHMRSRYGFLLARWKPEVYYWEMVYLLRRFLWAVIVNQIRSFPVLCATCAQMVLFGHCTPRASGLLSARAGATRAVCPS